MTEKWKHKYEWDRRVILERREFMYKGQPANTVKLATKGVIQHVTGEFETTLNLNRLLAFMASRAARTKSGKSTFQRGMVKCKKLSSTQKDDHVENYASPGPGWTEVNI